MRVQNKSDIPQTAWGGNRAGVQRSYSAKSSRFKHESRGAIDALPIVPNQMKGLVEKDASA